MNKPLTQDEVRELPDKTKVWVEVREDYPENWAGIHTMETTLFMHKRIIDKEGDCFYPEQIGEVCRVWELPEPPTPEELAACPWPKEAET